MGVGVLIKVIYGPVRTDLNDFERIYETLPVFMLGVLGFALIFMAIALYKSAIFESIRKPTV